METVQLNSKEYERVITMTDLTSKMQQLAFVYTTNAVKASERRYKRFRVVHYLAYDRINKDSFEKTSVLLLYVRYEDDQEELLATNSRNMIETFFDVVVNLGDEGLESIAFTISKGTAKNGGTFNVLEFDLA